ncbi:MAG: FkbM family methyltransferase [Candidatus Didemnitutus sp.]|nr:FkbM family methyltransferase [Candidatus Didemnitutus sp.]
MSTIADSFALRLGRALLSVRPAPLAVAIKRLLFLRRRVITTPAGTFWIDPASDAGQRVATHGHYDVATESLLARFLRPGDTFVDVGANEGFICVPAARLTGPTGRVVAVEPQLRLQPVLQRNFALNTVRVETHAVAISDHAGTAELQLAPDMNNSSTGFVTATRYPLKKQSIEILTLSAFLARLAIDSPFVLKMDIESWEHEAILGSPEIFREQRVRALFLELHPNLLQQRGLDPAAIPNFLTSCGYSHAPDTRGLVWIPAAATP